MKYKFIAAIFITLLTVIGFTMYVKQDMGLFLISFAEFQFQTNLIKLGFFVTALLVALFFSFKTYQKLTRGLSYIVPRRKVAQAEKGKQSLIAGLTELAEGHFEQAEKTLTQQIEFSQSTLLSYLAAARAAQHQGEHTRRDEYLRMAYKNSPESELAIGLTKAELQLAHGQNEQALATLKHLHKLSPNNSSVLTLLIETHRRLSDWQSMTEQLPKLIKTKTLTVGKQHELEMMAWGGQLKVKAEKDADSLMETWKRFPHHIKTLPEVIQQYAKLLQYSGNSEEAEKVLRKQLEKNWQASTIQSYAELDVQIDNKTLEHVESWTKKHTGDANLLLALGKLCSKQQLWGKARSYLEASLSEKPMSETCLKLAVLLEEHMEEPEQAQTYYRQGMHLIAGDTGNKSLVNAMNEFESTVEKTKLKVI